MNGPLVTNDDERDDFAAVAIECRHASVPVDLGYDDDAVMPTLVVLHTSENEPGVTFVDVSAVARPLDVRFGFESEEDAEELDRDAEHLGRLLETGRFDDKSGNRQRRRGSFLSSLVVETVLDRDDHDCELSIYAAFPTVVFAVSTFAVKETFARICGNLVDENDATDARSLLVVAPGTDLDGVVVSTDPAFGHVLVARLDNGDVEAVNLTAARRLYEAFGKRRHEDDEDEKEGVPPR